MLLGVWKALQTSQSAEKYAKSMTRSKERAAQKEEDKAIGLDSKKSSPVKGNKGTSRGGNVSKKMREITGMTKDMVGSDEATSTDPVSSEKEK